MMQILRPSLLIQIKILSSRTLMPLMTLMMLLQRTPVVKVLAEMTFSS